MSIPVSAAWQQAIQGQFRYPAYIKMALSLQPPGLREGATPSTDATEPITSTEVLFDGLQDVIEPVATFEQNRWRGDGSMYLPSENPSNNSPVEWWSNTCDFETVSLTFTFDKVYTVPGMFAVWDTETDSWPTLLTLEGINSSGESVGVYEITSVTSVSGYFDAPFDDVLQVVLTIHRWSKPNWRVRINEIVFGLYLRFSNDNVPAVSVVASSHLLAAELPKMSVKFTINNYDRTFDPMLREGYSRYLAERQQVELSWGFNVDGTNIEWMDPWPVYLSAWKIPADSPTVELTTTNRLSFLSSTYTRGTYDGSTRSFKAMALSVLQNCNIIRAFDDEEPWILDDLLDALYTRAPEPLEAPNVILQLIANATGCILDVAPETNYIRVRRSSTASPYSITTLQQLGDPAFNIADRLRSVQVGLRTFSQREAAEKVYSFEGHIAGSEVLEIKFDGNAIVVNPTATVSGASISTAVYYARRAFITLVADAAGADVTLTINGYVVDESTTYVQTYLNTDVDSGVEVVVDNPLITEMATLSRVAEVTKNYYLRRKTAKVTYTGYPEIETGDALAFKTNYGDFDAEIQNLALEFNGGFNGTLEVKALREEEDV